MTDAETLTSTIKDVLIRCNLQLCHCCGQAYNGASNMAGHISGVSTRIAAEEPRALYVHCLAHSLNLCLQDCSRYCDCVKNALSLASDLARLICVSPKRLALFRNFLGAQVNLQTTGIKPLCPTMWTVRTGALDAIIKNYEVIYMELDIVGKDSNDESSNKSPSLKALMERFSTFFGLKLSFMVFSLMEEFSKALQSSNFSAQEASSAAASALKFTKRQRSDDQFTAFYRSVVSEADHTDPPTLPKQRRMPKRFDDGSDNHNFSTPEDYLWQQYFEVLDLLAAEIERRFDQNSLKIISEIEQLLLKPCNTVSVQPSEEFMEKYSTDVNVERLKVQ